ncbi:MAG: ORF6N domain-containing protein [Azonexus sp.]|jgi:hypothetical protein|nr:ORF6N domain-containing protein [Azonexus sp.]
MSGEPLLPLEAISQRILVLREQKVLLDADLAALYGMETRRLNEQVRRNRERFPLDFMFELSPEEFASLKSQIATSSWGGRLASRLSPLSPRGREAGREGARRLAQRNRVRTLGGVRPLSPTLSHKGRGRFHFSA